MNRVSVVTVRQMGVVRCRFVPSSFVMLRGLPMMSSRVFVMFRCLMVMFCRFLRHIFSPSFV
jgi:hypothetical protein